MRVVLAAGLAASLAIECERPTREAAPVALPSISLSHATLAPAKATHASVQCTTDATYPGMWQLAEASAAVEFEPKPGERALIAFADSDNHGEAMILPIAPPGPLRPVKLEIDALASDDIEGAAWRGGHIYTLTSSGAVRRYTPSATGELVKDRTAYAIGRAPYVCDSLHDGNCGKNYEGLCLRPENATAPCAGYAASKAEGSLYCVVVRGDLLTIDATIPPIKLGLQKHALSDCAFGSAGGPAEGVLVVATNLYGGSAAYVVDETTGGLSVLDIPSLLNTEAVAVDRDGALYEFMDSNSSVSQSVRATCTGWTPAR